MIGPVDNRDVDFGVAESFGGVKSAKASANDYYARPSYRRATSPAPAARTIPESSEHEGAGLRWSAPAAFQNQRSRCKCARWTDRRPSFSRAPWSERSQ